ncbi:MAG: UDP-glucose 4-epimerase GalE [Verrucomicrobia bacterium]|nr:UDP-glucose 4-epimerase GalE [Verrucomicrobiota bacterium]
MNVLVAGGAGYIGSACVEFLCDAGHRVSVLDDLSEGHRQAIDPRSRFFHACLADREATREAVRQSEAEAILHLAAFALVGESMTHPGKYFFNNISCGLNLLEAAVACRVRKIVFSSTCATYGIPAALPMTESTPQNPINPYGESKRSFERILHWFREAHGLDFVAFRYFNAAGATPRFGEHHRVETHLIPNLLKVALGQAAEAMIFGTDYPTPDGTCVRDYIHVLDIARAHALALQSGASGFYNLGSGSGCSVREVLHACEAASGRTIPVKAMPRRPGDPPVLIASPEKVRLELGWIPTHTSVREIVASAWAWHQRHPHGYHS